MMDHIVAMTIGSIIPVLLWLVSAIIVAFISMGFDSWITDRYDSPMPYGFVVWVLYTVTSFVGMVVFLPSWIEYFLGTML